MPSNLYSRLKNTIQKMKPQLSPIKDEGVIEESIETKQQLKSAEYIEKASTMHIIRKCAKDRVLIYLSYDNVWRYVEPYSFRQGKQGMLFFGHDLYRNDTRSYYMHKIQQLQETTIPFAPRWLIEL